MEDEYHFLNICPAYQEKRSSLPDYLENEYRIKISRMSPNKILQRGRILERRIKKGGRGKEGNACGQTPGF